jgi:hypothetical protein
VHAARVSPRPVTFALRAPARRVTQPPPRRRCEPRTAKATVRAAWLARELSPAQELAQASAPEDRLSTPRSRVAGASPQVARAGSPPIRLPSARFASAPVRAA